MSRKIFFIILAVLFLSPILGLRTADAQVVYQPKDLREEYLRTRAIELAAFRDNELPVEPEIKYILPGEQMLKSTNIDPSIKVVTILDPSYGLGGVQAIFRSPIYNISDAGHLREYASFGATVGDILENAGIILAKEDQVTPKVEERPRTNSISIIRVTVAEIEQFETLPFKTKEIDDPDLERGKKNVTEEGKVGKRRYLYRVRRENGLEVSRDLIKDEIIEPPKNRVVVIGTKVMVLSSISGEASWTKGLTAMRRYRRGTLIRVTNPANGKSVDVRVGGWGPQEWTGRILDLEQAAFAKIADLGAGRATLLVEELKE